MPDKETLAAINATLNGISFLLLMWGYIQIRKDHVQRHRTTMLTALATSAAFLTTYLTSYFVYGDKSTGEMGLPMWMRVSYLLFLLVHVLAAVGMLPLIGAALYYAFRGKFETHKKFSRPAFWIWLYVSVTGVMLYFILYWFLPIYQTTSEL